MQLSFFSFHFSLPSPSFLKKPSLPCLPVWQVVLFGKDPFPPLTSYCPHPTVPSLSLVPWLSLAGLSLQTLITAPRLVGLGVADRCRALPLPHPKSLPNSGLGVSYRILKSNSRLLHDKSEHLLGLAVPPLLMASLGGLICLRTWQHLTYRTDVTVSAIIDKNPACFDGKQEVLQKHWSPQEKLPCDFAGILTNPEIFPARAPTQRELAWGCSDPWRAKY